MQKEKNNKAKLKWGNLKTAVVVVLPKNGGKNSTLAQNGDIFGPGFPVVSKEGSNSIRCL